MTDYPPYLDYPKERKPQTNYDRIISKTPEKLAELLNKTCPPKTTANTCRRMFNEETGKYNCVKCWLDWLTSPVDKEE